jgi:hypothetical protein
MCLVIYTSVLAIMEIKESIEECPILITMTPPMQIQTVNIPCMTVGTCTVIDIPRCSLSD